MKTRTEHDTMGPVEVPADKYWELRPNVRVRTSVLAPKALCPSPS